MNGTTTYEVVGDFLKVFEAGGVWDVKTTFNYIKNGNIEIIGPTYTPKTITIVSSGTVSYTHLTLPTKRIV